MPSFVIACPWHLTVFAPAYRELAMYRDDVIVPFGLLSMLIQGAAFSWVYPRIFASVGPLSGVSDYAGEPFVHVILMMAMKQGRPRIVRDEVDFGLREARHTDRVLHEPRYHPIADFRHLERMAMQVYGMLIATVIVHDDPIALAPFNGEQRIRVGS